MNPRNLIFAVLSLLTASAIGQTNGTAVATNAPAVQRAPTLNFETALRLTVRNDPVIAIARSAARIDSLEYRQSRKAMGPTAAFEGEYRMNEGGDPSDPFTSKFNPDEQWRGMFKVTQSIYDARISPAESRDLSRAQASASDVTNTIRQRLLLTGVQYFRAIQAQTILNVAEQAKQLADLEVQRANLRVQAGEARQTDLLRAQVDQSRAERELNESRNDVVLAARELFRLCGIPQDSTVNVEPPPSLPEPASEDLNAMLRLARISRADFVAASNRIAAAEQQVRVTKNDFYPKFELQLTETLADPEIYQKGRDTWDILVTAKFNIWDKGARSTRRMQDAERLEQARLQLEQLEKIAATETDRALATLAVARLNFQTAQREEALAEQNYNILSEQAKNGLATALDVSTALVDLGRSRMAKVRLQYEVEIAKFTLYAVTGQLSYSE
jgi:outer membrane protein TolC